MDLHLSRGEVVVGMAHRFQGRFGCVGFLYKGPRDQSITIADGWWREYASLSEGTEQAVMQEVEAELDESDCGASSEVGN